MLCKRDLNVKTEIVSEIAFLNSYSFRAASFMPVALQISPFVRRAGLHFSNRPVCQNVYESECA
jgi:hypothetical protein